ncbi:MAG: hypothetical protein ACI9J3_003081 [Parvicellaceae bacterium]|jgi:hypothetical protein
MESKIYRAGRAFSNHTIGLYGIVMVIVICLMLLGNLIVVLIGLPFIAFLLIIVFTSKRIQLEYELAQSRNLYRFFGLEFKSQWKRFDNAKGLIIRFKRLSDRKRSFGNSSYGPSGSISPMTLLSAGVGGNASVTYDTAWYVSAIHSTTKKDLIMISGKSDALEFVNQMVDKCGFEIYSGYYKKDRKLNRDQLKLGNIVFQKKPDIIKTRRR